MCKQLIGLTIALIAFFTSGTLVAQDSKQPNIIFILTDDQR